LSDFRPRKNTPLAASLREAVAKRWLDRLSAPLRQIVEQVGDLRQVLAGEEEADVIADRLLGGVGLAGAACPRLPRAAAGAALVRACGR